MTDSTSQSESPRELMFDVVGQRIAVLADFAKRNCKNDACGTRDDEGIPIPCGGAGCGEKRLGHSEARELEGMRKVYALLEWLERQEMEKRADNGRRKSRG